MFDYDSSLRVLANAFGYDIGHGSQFHVNDPALIGGHWGQGLGSTRAADLGHRLAGDLQHLGGLGSFVVVDVYGYAYGGGFFGDRGPDQMLQCLEVLAVLADKEVGVVVNTNYG